MVRCRSETIGRERLECGGPAAAFAIFNASRSALAPRSNTRLSSRPRLWLRFHRTHCPPLAVIHRSVATNDDSFFASVHVVFPTEGPFSARRGISLPSHLLATPQNHHGSYPFCFSDAGGRAVDCGAPADRSRRVVSRKGGGRATALQRFLADYVVELLQNLPLC
jgi:hypothetical protein